MRCIRGSITLCALSSGTLRFSGNGSRREIAMAQQVGGVHRKVRGSDPLGETLFCFFLSILLALPVSEIPCKHFLSVENPVFTDQIGDETAFPYNFLFLAYSNWFLEQ